MDKVCYPPGVLGKEPKARHWTITARKQLWPDLGSGSLASKPEVLWLFLHGSIPKAEDCHCTSGTKNIHPASARYLIKNLRFKILWQNFFHSFVGY